MIKRKLKIVFVWQRNRMMENFSKTQTQKDSKRRKLHFESRFSCFHHKQNTFRAKTDKTKINILFLHCFIIWSYLHFWKKTIKMSKCLGHTYRHIFTQWLLHFYDSCIYKILLNGLTLDLNRLFPLFCLF